MKRKLSLSILVFMLCVALVGGATFAIFTDTANNSNNVFTAGTLVIGTENAGANTGTMLFEKAAPGDSYEYTITVKNLGTLPFLYKVSAAPNAAQTDDSLYNALMVKVNNLPEMPLTSLNNLALNLNMAAGTSEPCTIKVSLPLSAGNALQNKSAIIDFTFDAQQVGTTKNLVNGGFETGDLTGWQIISAADEVTVTGADTYASPLYGNYMVRLGGPSYQPPGQNKIAQTFQVTAPQLNFAYNIFTTDYAPYDNFEYKVSVVHNGNVIQSYTTPAFGSGGTLVSTGWQAISLDLTGYVGQDVEIYVSAGGTLDSAYPTWAYFDSME